MSLNGWIILDKPVGLGSTQAVGAIKRLLRESGEPKTKVGHGGTLDPLASGVLPIALGEATKLCGRMLDATKAYDFTIRFGEETDTLDAEGEVVATSAVRPTLGEIQSVLACFTGQIEQVPPAYSALKIDGKAAYARARAGEKVELKSRNVTISDLGLREATKYLDQAVSLDFLTEIAKARQLTRAVLPLEAALDDIPALPVTPDQAQLLRHGQKLFGFPATPGLQLASTEGTPVALVEASADGLRVVRGFNL
jgi:tRNA pseudouridine55 synthase